MDKKYSVFVRNKKSNKVDVFYISDKDIYGEGESYKKPYNNLYEIDLFTSKFKNEEDLINYIYGDNKKVEVKDVDVYAVSINGDMIDIQGSLFASTKKEENNDLFKRNPTYGSILGSYRDFIYARAKGKDKEKYKYIVDSILSDFSYVMSRNEDFYNFIMSCDNRIDRNYLDYYKGGFKNYDMRTPIKDRDGGWAKEYDLLLRQIVEAFQMYEDKSRRNGEKLANERNSVGGETYYEHYDSFSRYYNQFIVGYDDIMMIDDTAELMANMDPNMFVFENNVPKIDLSRYDFYDKIDCSKVNKIDPTVMKIIYSYAVYMTFYNNGDRDYDNFLVDLFDRLLNVLRVNPDIAKDFGDFLIAFNNELENSNKRSDKGGVQKRKDN